MWPDFNKALTSEDFECLPCPLPREASEEVRDPYGVIELMSGDPPEAQHCCWHPDMIWRVTVTYSVTADNGAMDVQQYVAEGPMGVGNLEGEYTSRSYDELGDHIPSSDITTNSAGTLDYNFAVSCGLTSVFDPSSIGVTEIGADTGSGWSSCIGCDFQYSADTRDGMGAGTLVEVHVKVEIVDPVMTCDG